MHKHIHTYTCSGTTVTKLWHHAQLTCLEFSLPCTMLLMQAGFHWIHLMCKVCRFYACMCLYMCIYTNMYIFELFKQAGFHWIHLTCKVCRFHVCMYVCVCMCVCVCFFVCMYTCIYASVCCVCACVYTCICKLFIQTSYLSYIHTYTKIVHVLQIF
jgi:hypothetical protein